MVAFTTRASLAATWSVPSAFTVKSFPSTVTFTSAVTFVTPSAIPVITAFLASLLSFATEAISDFSTDHVTSVTSPALTVTAALAFSSALMFGLSMERLAVGALMSGSGGVGSLIG